MFQKNMDETITLWGNLKLSGLRKNLKWRFLTKCENESNYCKKCFDEDKIFKGKIEVHPLDFSLWVNFCDTVFTDPVTGETETCWEHRRLIEIKFNNSREYWNYHKYISDWAYTETKWNRRRIVRDKKEREARVRRRREMVKEDEKYEKMRNERKMKNKMIEAEEYFNNLHDKNEWPELCYEEDEKMIFS